MRTVLPLFLNLALSTFSPLSAGGNEDPSVQAPYASPRLSGEGVVAFTSSNVHLMGWKVISDFPGGNASAMDCWGYTSPSGREYAIIALGRGTGFVEVTDPGNPVIVRHIAGPDGVRSVKVFGDHAYACSEGGAGIQVFDLTGIDSGSVTLQATVTTGGCTTATHTLALDPTSAFLYRAGGGGSAACGGGPQGLTIYSLADPALPAFVGSWNEKYVHECQVETWDVPGPHFGKQIAFCFTTDDLGVSTPRFTILDVTDKAAIAQLASVTYPGAAWSHQGWTSADKQHLYLNDEFDDEGFGASRTRIFDISDLAAPTYSGFFSSGAASRDHNLYVKENRIFEANYRSGLRVFDSTVPTAPTQIGFFDTWPNDDALEINSLWSNYPYFASGTVIGGDWEKGLFVWRVGQRAVDFAYPYGLFEFNGTSTRVQFDVSETVPGTLQEGTVALHYSLGGPFTTVPATRLGAERYEAELPASRCGERIAYYFSCRMDDGATWTDPPAAPTQAYSAVSAFDSTVGHSDTFEASSGWLVNQAADIPGGATATTGSWTRVNPVGSGAQPEDDHTPAGSFCFVTGQGIVGGPVGDGDVDGGYTALRSPVLDASAMSDPHISYWRWFSNYTNGTADDTLTVWVSNDGGTIWMPVETVGPAGFEAKGGWILADFRVADFVPPTNNMRVRFRTSDRGTGSIVEAGIDDLQIVDYSCDSLTATGISPATGPFRGGNVVTITGTSFVAGTTTVRFGFEEAVVNVLSPTTLEATVPSAPSTQFDKFRPAGVTVDVTVANPGWGRLAGAYSYQPPPRRDL